MCNHRRQSSMGTGVPPFRRPVPLMVVVALLASAARADDPPSAAPPQSVLHLANGGFAAGELRASTKPGVLRWQAASFVSPFDFAAREVIGDPVAAPGVAAQAERRFLLRAGRGRRAVRLAGRPE